MGLAGLLLLGVTTVRAVGTICDNSRYGTTLCDGSVANLTRVYAYL